MSCSRPTHCGHPARTRPSPHAARPAPAPRPVAKEPGAHRPCLLPSLAFSKTVLATMFSSSIDSRRSAREPAGGAVSAWGCCRCCCCRCSGCRRCCRSRSREPGARLSYRIIPALFPQSFPPSAKRSRRRRFFLPLCPPSPLPQQSPPHPPPSAFLCHSILLPSGSLRCFNASDASASPPSLPGVWY